MSFGLPLLSSSTSRRFGSLNRKRKFESEDDLLDAVTSSGPLLPASGAGPGGQVAPTPQNPPSLRYGVTAPVAAVFSNPNLKLVTQITATAMSNPLDLSEVSNEADRKRLERIDNLFCSMRDDMPLLTKHKVKHLMNHYVLRYQWDDSVFRLGVIKLYQHFEPFMAQIRDIDVGNQDACFYIWTESELEKQGLAVPLRPGKRARMDDPITTAIGDDKMTGIDESIGSTAATTAVTI